MLGCIIAGVIIGAAASSSTGSSSSAYIGSTTSGSDSNFYSGIGAFGAFLGLVSFVLLLAGTIGLGVSSADRRE